MATSTSTGKVKRTRRDAQTPSGSSLSTFVALDFETANHDRASACAVSAVVVESGKIEVTRTRFIRPPTSFFAFTDVHGIDWGRVRVERTFKEVWADFAALIEQASFVAAHNATFDRSVLEACCRAAGIPTPRVPFVCTVKLARRVWGIFPTRLPDVCRELGIKLKHHDPASDAEACARIVLAAVEAGVDPVGLQSPVRTARRA
jgi:DNA polymerase-3 subunit epsilon